MKTSQILRDARAIIEEPKRWTIGAHARNADGISVACNSPRAVCFWMIGDGHWGDVVFHGVPLRRKLASTAMRIEVPALANVPREAPFNQNWAIERASQDRLALRAVVLHLAGLQP